MEKIILKSIIFILLIFFSCFIVLIQADGYADAFYLRFTTPRQHSLIIGTSRSAQGLQPAILNRYLSRNDIYNYSFTIMHSPYGPTYLNSIKKKLDPKTKDGIFILAVDPWSLSSTGDGIDNIAKFRETKLCLANTKSVDTNPNIEYLLNNIENRSDIFLKKFRDYSFLHSDGWLEINVNMDLKNVEQRTNKSIISYKDFFLGTFKNSQIRLGYLTTTICYLQQYGKVFLVRLPVNPEIMKIEQEFSPDFNIMIKKNLPEGINYYDMTPLNRDFIYTDGNHLYKDSGAEVSELVANWILKQ